MPAQMPVPETLVIEMPAETLVIEMPAEIQRDACKHATSEGSSTERRGTKHLRTKDCGNKALFSRRMTILHDACRNLGEALYHELLKQNTLN